MRETRYGRVPSECQNDIHRTDQCAISTGAPNSAEAGRWPFVGMINDHTFGRVEDGRGGLGLWPSPRFPSPLIEPDVPISGIRLSDWLHREVHGEQTNRTRLRHGE